MKPLNECRVVVTGAASGIGAAIAQAFAKQNSRLVLCDLNAEGLEQIAQLCRQFDTQVTTIIADLGTEQGAHQTIDCCVKTYGGIDVLVNNAGILTQAPCTELSKKMWDDMLRIDLTSVFLTSQRALPHMIKQKWGRIINISSQLGIKGGIELAHYCAAKAGVIGFTKSLAQEVAKDNVLVNAIAPGPIATPLVDGISQSWKDEKAKQLPLGRFGTAEEIAPTVILLASDPGGNLYVGQTLGPNSGDVMP